MNYWWVNQNKTYRHEVTGRYMWSPKRNRDGVRSRFYENMKAVAPGDVVFSSTTSSSLTSGSQLPILMRQYGPPNLAMRAINGTPKAGG